MRTYTILFIAAVCFFVAGVKNTVAGPEVDTKLNVVVIDPGHGGKDSGASSAGVKEKDIVLAIALKLGKLIEDTYPDVKVIYTRKTDVFIPLHERARIANKNKADLFISIHANYVGVKSVSGAETFVLGNSRIDENLDIVKKENSVILLEDDYSTTYEGFDPNSSESYIMFETIQGEYLEQSLQFASFIQNHFKIKANRADRGVKQNIFLVLRETTMPSVLVETGFISNEKERLYMNSEEGRNNLSEAIFKAFGNYKTIVEQKSALNGYKTVWPTDSVKGNKAAAESLVLYTNLAAKDTAVAGAKGASNISAKIIAGNTGPADSAVNAGPLDEKSANPGSLLPVINPEPKTPVLTGSTIDSANKSQVIPTEKADLKIWFSVQLTISTKPVNLAPENFKGEKAVYSLKIGNSYKYYSGKFGRYNQASAEKARLQGKFNDAFIVAFEDGLPIPIKEAIQKTSK